LSDRYILREIWSPSGTRYDAWTWRWGNQVGIDTHPASGFNYALFAAEPNANRGTLKVTPYDSSPTTGPGETFDNIKICMDIFLPGSHPLTNLGTSPPGNIIWGLDTIDPEDIAEISYSASYPSASKLRCRWTTIDSVNKLEFRTEGNDGTSNYANTRHRIDTSEFMIDDEWTHIEITARLNPNTATGDGSLLKIDRIRPEGFENILTVSNERWDRSGKGFRILSFGFMEDDVGQPPEGNWIGFGPITIENLDAPKADIGGIGPSGFYSGIIGIPLLFDASNSELPMDETGSPNISQIDFSWDFGDNNTQTGLGLSQPSHTYSAIGRYRPSVTLTYNNLSDTVSGVTQVYSSIPEDPGDPAYSGVVNVEVGGYYVGFVGDTINFSAAQSSSDIPLSELYWSWQFLNASGWSVVRRP